MCIFLHHQKKRELNEENANRFFIKLDIAKKVDWKLGFILILNQNKVKSKYFKSKNMFET